MLFKKIKKPQDLNVAGKKYLIDFAENFKSFEYVIVVFLIIPILLNFIFYFFYGKTNNLKENFLLIAKLFDAKFYNKYCYKILLGILQGIFYTAFIICVIARLGIAIVFNKNLNIYKKLNISFYKKFKWLFVLSIFVPFVVKKIHENLLIETDFIGQTPNKTKK